MVWWKNCRENANTRQTIQKIYIKKIHVDEKTCKEACNTVQNLIRRKKEACLEEVLKRDMANSKKNWKTFKTTRSARKKVTMHWCLSKSRRRVHIWTLNYLKNSIPISQVFGPKAPWCGQKIWHKGCKNYYNDKFE